MCDGKQFFIYLFPINGKECHNGGHVGEGRGHIFRSLLSFLGFSWGVSSVDALTDDFVARVERVGNLQ